MNRPIITLALTGEEYETIIVALQDLASLPPVEVKGQEQLPGYASGLLRQLGRQEKGK